MPPPRSHETSRPSCGFDHAFVVLAYKRSPFLAGCLDTLIQQTVSSRILIATSTPNELITEQADRVGAEVRVNPRHEGIGADWNFALRASGARYVTLVHQDDVYRADFLELSLKALIQHSAALCFTGYQEIDEPGKPISTKVSKVTHLLEAVMLARAVKVPSWRMRAFLAFGAPLPASSVTYDLSQLDGFEFSHDYAANLDWDAWLRLLDLKKQFARVPGRRVGRRHGQFSATSHLIANGSRRRDDLALFRRIWPQPLSDAIALLYRLGY